MRTSLRWIAIAVCCAVLLGVASYGLLRAGQREATIFYVPFELETLYPITAENIDEGAYNVLPVDETDPRFERVLRSVNQEGGPPVKFDAQLVRMKIKRANGSVVLVDRDGGVRSEHGERKLTASSFDELKKVMRELAPHDF